MNCCTLSCCILMARLAGVSIQYRNPWLWCHLHYIYIVLEARGVQNQYRSDVGWLLPSCQISYSKWLSSRVTFMTVQRWEMRPANTELTHKIVFWQSGPAGWVYTGPVLYNLQPLCLQFSAGRALEPHSPSLLLRKHFVQSSSRHKKESGKGLIYFLWSFVLALQQKQLCILNLFSKN